MIGWVFWRRYCRKIVGVCLFFSRDEIRFGGRGVRGVV